jgi:cytidylate kinase
MTARSFVIAIDGPGASGKGTLARRLAEHFGFAHLDTGALYRATAFLVLEQAGDPADPVTAARAAGLVFPGLLSDPRLRGEAVSAAASIVAAIPGVRRALLDLQRNFAAHPPRPSKGAILDGRDIGSVVCPAANVKLFITASAEERARRRVEELRQQGAAAILEDVLQDLKERDARDIERRAAPLIVAPDAAVIDTTTLDADAVFERVSNLIARALTAQR